ncbi:RNA guanine-N7 methyltransferase activating subunit [Rhinatrema bivittatum]|uniref:RNA guanine-N7 methyltransferase activating subunit n=1 Tax=Rhinatrema bivittatum TaxID=194408 RepID=UPI00112A5EAB|nr:RNA guanine-N7 methyltransferase activating subunit [Rhinatrema bivittatum]XP_029430877.1 RNA guanine-N7 methyltransferase activating subunit [Rhinatrema bivittatum]
MTATSDTIPNFEEMFGHRFTIDDLEYQEYLKRPADPPPVVEDWRNRSGGNQRNQDNRIQDRRRFRERGRRDYSYNRSDQQWQGRGWENNHYQHRQGQPYYPQYGQYSYNSYNRRPYRDYY